MFLSFNPKLRDHYNIILCSWILTNIVKFKSRFLEEDFHFFYDSGFSLFDFGSVVGLFSHSDHTFKRLIILPRVFYDRRPFLQFKHENCFCMVCILNCKL